MRLQKIRDISKQVNIDVQTQRVLRCLAVFIYIHLYWPLEKRRR